VTYPKIRLTDVWVSNPPWEAVRQPIKQALLSFPNPPKGDGIFDSHFRKAPWPSYIWRSM